jgi:AcrR family transcriptional regulator
MNELSSNIGISKKTIYQYFSSKEEIVESCIEHIFEDIDSKILPLMKDSELDVLSKLNRLTITVSESLRTYSKMQTLDFQRSFPALWNKVNIERTQRIQRYEELFADGVKQKVFRQFKPEILVHLYIVAIQSLTSPSFLESHDLTLSEAITMVKSIILNGILAPTIEPCDRDEEIDTDI